MKFVLVSLTIGSLVVGGVLLAQFGAAGAAGLAVFTRKRGRRNSANF